MFHMLNNSYYQETGGRTVDGLDVEVAMDSAWEAAKLLGAGKLTLFNEAWANQVKHLAARFTPIHGSPRVADVSLSYYGYQRDSRGNGFIYPIPHDKALILYLEAEALRSALCSTTSTDLVDDLSTLDRDGIAARVESLRQALIRVTQ